MPGQITIIAENRVALSRGLIAEHGFAALIEINGFKLLFDTGQGFALRQNQALLGYDLGKIDALALSHGHFDHTSGTPYVLEKNPGVKIYCHREAFSRRKVRKEIGGKLIEVEVGMTISEKQIRDKGAEIFWVEEPRELAEGGILLACPVPLESELETPEPGFLIERDGRFVPDDFPDDLAVAARGSKGISVIFGCAHRGAINTLGLIEKFWAMKKLDTVLGGLHLLGRGPEQVERTIEEISRFSPERVAVGHCTGDFALSRLERRFGNKFSFAGAGSKFPIE